MKLWLCFTGPARDGIKLKIFFFSPVFIFYFSSASSF
jgi:hypothetical protein